VEAPAGKVLRECRAKYEGVPQKIRRAKRAAAQPAVGQKT
jgi:hypothetical protein